MFKIGRMYQAAARTCKNLLVFLLLANIKELTPAVSLDTVWAFIKAAQRTCYNSAWPRITGQTLEPTAQLLLDR